MDLNDIGCVIMASGIGRRFGSNKLMADFRGEPMIARILAATAGVPRRVVVTRHEDVAEFCRSKGITVVMHTLPYHNDTVRLGLDSLAGVKLCMFCPGDQPLLTSDTVNALICSALAEPERIWRTENNGEPGSPVIFPEWAFSELLNLPEDKGGGFVIKNHPEQVSLLPVRDAYELMDADTPQELQKLLEYKKIRPKGPIFYAYYFSSFLSLGRRMLSRIATTAAGTMPDPPNMREIIWGALARMPAFAPMP